MRSTRTPLNERGKLSALWVTNRWSLIASSIDGLEGLVIIQIFFKLNFLGTYLHLF